MTSSSINSWRAVPRTPQQTVERQLAFEAARGKHSRASRRLEGQQLFLIENHGDQWTDAPRMLKRNCQPRIPYPAWPFFKKGETKVLLSKQEWGSTLLAELLCRGRWTEDRRWDEERKSNGKAGLRSREKTVQVHIRNFRSPVWFKRQGPKQ